MKRNDAILRLALKENKNLPANDHPKILGSNFQENKTVDSSENTLEVQVVISSNEHIKSLPIEKANFDIPNDHQTQSEKVEDTRRYSASDNTEIELLPSTSGQSTKDQSFQKIEKPIDGSTTDCSSDTESTSSSDSSSSTLNEDSDDSVKDPDFENEQRRSCAIPKDSKTEDDIDNSTNVADPSVSSGSTVDVTLRLPRTRFFGS